MCFRAVVTTATLRLTCEGPSAGAVWAHAATWAIPGAETKTLTIEQDGRLLVCEQIPARHIKPATD
jgi:hypothetical protein